MAYYSGEETTSSQEEDFEIIHGPPRDEFINTGVTRANTITLTGVAALPQKKLHESRSIKFVSYNKYRYGSSIDDEERPSSKPSSSATLLDDRQPQDDDDDDEGQDDDEENECATIESNDESLQQIGIELKERNFSQEYYISSSEDEEHADAEEDDEDHCQQHKSEEELDEEEGAVATAAAGVYVTTFVGSTASQQKEKKKQSSEAIEACLKSHIKRKYFQKMKISTINNRSILQISRGHRVRRMILTELKIKARLKTLSSKAVLARFFKRVSSSRIERFLKLKKDHEIIVQELDKARTLIKELEVKIANSNRRRGFWRFLFGWRTR